MDKQLLLWINQGWSNPFNDALFYLLSQRTAFAIPLLLLISIIFLRQFGVNGLRLLGLLVLIVFIGDQIGNQIKHLIHQPRPCAILFEIVNQPSKSDQESCDAMTTGMPSNHALNYFLAATFLSNVLHSWKWGCILMAIALLVSLSRIYLGLHYPTQVLAGAALGIFIGALCARLGLAYLSFIKAIRRQTDQRLNE
jgi:undecaprenyl-diphosphatase